MGSRERPKTECPGCHVIGKVDRGRACDGRRAYRCKLCGAIWTSGTNGRKWQHSSQRESYQFADTGAGSSEKKRSPNVKLGYDNECCSGCSYSNTFGTECLRFPTKDGPRKLRFNERLGNYRRCAACLQAGRINQ